MSNLLYQIAQNTAGIPPAVGDSTYNLAYKIAQNTAGVPPRAGDSLYNLFYKIAQNTAGTPPKIGDGLHGLLFKIAGNTGGSPVIGDGEFNLLYKIAQNTAGGAPAPISPDQIPGLLAWYDASDAASFTYNTGTSVQTWADKSVAGWTLTYDPASTSRPTRGATDWSATMPGVTFVNGFFAAADDTGKKCAVFVVCKLGTLDATYRAVASDDGWMLLVSDLTGAGKWGTFPPAGVITTLVNGTKYLLEMSGGTSGTFYLNGVNDGTYATTSGNSTNLRVGANAANQLFLGVIAEVLLYDPTLITDTDRAKVRNYLNSKWTIYPTYDTDAANFFTRAGITDATQKAAVNELTTTLKSAGIWTKMKVLYPLVGGTAATHSHNLVSSSYQMTWGVGVTHDANGFLTPLGIYYETGNWSNTNFNLSTVMTPESLAFGFYSRTNLVNSYPADMVADQTYLGCQNFGNVSTWRNCATDEANWSGPHSTDGYGLWICTRISSSSMKLFQNASQRGTTSAVAQGPLPNTTMMIDRAYGNTADTYSMHQKALVFISDGLTDAEVATFTTAVQTFQTALGRQK